MVVMPPQPSALVASLRSIGYTLETAIADIIDNSITAQAKKVCVIGVKLTLAKVVLEQLYDK